MTLFAAVGLIVGGSDDVAVDLVWAARASWRRLTVYRRHPRATAATLSAPRTPGRIAIFVAAWEESAVIGAMLRTALARFEHGDYLIFVGTYANDPATQGVVSAIGDPRIRMVCGGVHGPTTKAECLNRCWRALLDEEAGIM